MGTEIMEIQTSRRASADLAPRDDPTRSPAGNATSPSDAERAARASANDRLDAFIAGGADTTPANCTPEFNPRYDYDRCGSAAAVPDAALFVAQRQSVADVELPDVTQGGLGDCHVMATLCALANTKGGRATIHDAIVENKNDKGEVVSYTVTLHKPERHWFGPTTFQDAKVTVDGRFMTGHAEARSEKGASNEVWPLVIEKAYARLSGGYNAIGHGGYASDVMEAVTGREAKHIELGLFTRYGGAAMQRDVAAGRIVVLGTKGGVLGHGLAEHHAYAVVGTRTSGGKLNVLIQNPWKITNPPTSIPVDELGALFHAVYIGSTPQ